jgi:hypothetical protein
VSWPTVLAGLGAVAMIAFGFNTTVPLSETVDTLCDMAGLCSGVIELADDPDSQGNRFLELDRE